IVTATLRGVFGPAGVVVGPFKQAVADVIIFQLASGTNVGPPFFCHHSNPASQLTKLTEPFTALIILRAASISSGPVPSPLINATVGSKTHPLKPQLWPP